MAADETLTFTATTSTATAGQAAPAAAGPAAAAVPRPAHAAHASSVTGHIPTSVQYTRLYLRMGISDVAAIVVVLVAATLIRYGHLRPRDWLLFTFLPLLAVPAVFVPFRLYEVHRVNPAEEFRRVLLAVSLVITGISFLAFWSDLSLSRLWFGLTWVLATIVVLLTRRFWRGHVRRRRTRGDLSFRTLMVGTNDEAGRVVRMMADQGLGFRPLGFVSTEPEHQPFHGLPVLGSISELRELIRDTGAECVFLASSALRVDDAVQVSQALRLEGVEMRVTASLPEVLASRLSVQPLGGLMALSLRPVKLSGAQMVLKRTFDLVLGTLALLAFLPLWVAIGLTIKVTSRGPILYRQERVGFKQRSFTIYKFRTMVRGADLMLDSLRDSNEATGPLFKLRNDPRVTPVGKWLRKWSLDELPQLLNVLKGDMSLVGPRPPMESEVKSYEPWMLDRLAVRPGLTGLWQVSGRSDLSFDDYVRLDLFYIENWSLSYDLFILLKTFPVMISRKGAY